MSKKGFKVNDNKFIYKDEILRKEALKFKTRGEFQKKSRGHYRAAHRKGESFFNEICSHMEQVLSYWPEKKLHKEALKFKTRSEFKENSESAYNIALKKGKNFFNEICSHMPKRVDISSKNNPNFKWTTQKIHEEALKYKTRMEFKKKKSFVYDTARNRGILDEVCSHMKILAGISNPEKDLFNGVKSLYPKAQKLRDKKVKIKGKLHITGFDIDIYVPELRKGIEFDGNYFHSVKGLKRGRPNWAEEDLLSYHEIKDSYFASKGIQILHIKESDWNNNRAECITKIEQFLGITGFMSSEPDGIGLTKDGNMLENEKNNYA